MQDNHVGTIVIGFSEKALRIEEQTEKEPKTIIVGEREAEPAKVEEARERVKQKLTSKHR